MKLVLETKKYYILKEYGIYYACSHQINMSYSSHSLNDAKNFAEKIIETYEGEQCLNKNSYNT
jgi:hypothetical protein